MLSVPFATLSVVVSTTLSMSDTDTPAIGSAESSFTVCAPGTVLIGGSPTAPTAIPTVSISLKDRPTL
jgi:hypothetical protein